MRPLSVMPYGLAPLLEKLKPGELSQPIKLGNKFCIVELTERRESELNEETIKVLLESQLKLWIQSVMERIEDEVDWTNQAAAGESR